MNIAFFNTKSKGNIRIRALEHETGVGEDGIPSIYSCSYSK